VFVTSGALTPLYWFFEVLSVAALGAEVWAFVDAVRRPAPAFPAAGKQTKPLWLVILGVAAVIGLWSATLGGPNLVSLFPIVAFVAAAIPHRRPAEGQGVQGREQLFRPVRPLVMAASAARPGPRAVRRWAAPRPRPAVGCLRE